MKGLTTGDKGRRSKVTKVEGLSRRMCPPRNCKVVSAPLDQSSSRFKSEYKSAVARHLAQNRQCAMAYDDSSFVFCVFVRDTVLM